MADIKISELGAASAVNNVDLIPMTSAGVTVKATAQQFKDYMGVGNLANLSTDAKSNLVAAINEVDSHANTNAAAIGTLTNLNTNVKTSAVAAINEVNTKVSKTEVLASNIESSIATVQTTLVASKAYAVGEQFVYNGLLYKATATIAQGGTITIGGNCELADSVTEQIENMSHNIFGNEIDEGDGYTTQTDGYYTFTNNRSTGDFSMQLNGVSMIYKYIHADEPYVKISIYVKKGMTITHDNTNLTGGGYYSKFNPLIN